MSRASAISPDQFATFGDLLKYLRRRAGLTQRELSIAVGYSDTQISRMEQNQRVPDQATLTARFVPPLHLEHEPQWVTRLLELAVDAHRDDGPTPTTDAPAPPTTRHNLPLQLTSFIGREREIAEVQRLLSTARLVTLTGPGGTGKTRLALETAAEQVGQFAHGVWFVPLAGLSSGEALAPAIVSALALSLYGSDDPKTQLLNYLSEREVLLVLDNFEHLLSGAGLITAIVQAAPKVKVLATSRERLNLYGEWVYEVGGLAVPPGDALEGIEHHSAVRLFVESAQRVQSSFALRAEERPHIAHICRLVGGMPLGIELAAAWLPVLSCAEIAQEIQRSVDFLAASTPNMEGRHRNMRAVFDQSWQLLTEPDRAVFQRLAIFRGGFTRDAAETVAGATLIALARLASKSLIRRAPSGRYEIHELLRQYGESKLREHPEDEQEALVRHGAYYLDFLAQREATLKGREQLTALAEIAADVENIWIAWDWGARHCQAERIAQSFNALWFFTEVNGLYSELGRAAEQVASALEHAPDTVSGRTLALGQAFVNQGSPYVRLGDVEQGQRLINQGLTLLRSLNANRDIAFALNGLAANVHLQGAYAEEQQLLSESIALGQLSGDRWITGYSLNDLGMVTFLLGDAAEPARLCRESLVIFREVGDQRGLAFTLKNLGIITHYLGEYAEAERLYYESLALWRAINHRWGIATTLTQLGLVARAKGNRPTAQAYFLEAIRTALDVSLWPMVLDTLVELAALALEEGEVVPAREMLLALLRHPARTTAAQHKAERLLSELALSPVTPIVSATPDAEAVVAQLLRAGAAQAGNISNPL